MQQVYKIMKMQSLRNAILHYWILYSITNNILNASFMLVPTFILVVWNILKISICPLSRVTVKSERYCLLCHSLVWTQGVFVATNTISLQTEHSCMPQLKLSRLIHLPCGLTFKQQQWNLHNKSIHCHGIFLLLKVSKALLSAKCGYKVPSMQPVIVLSVQI